MSITYYVVQPFERTERDELVPGAALQVHGGAGAATAMARRLAEKGGAIAFSRTGDPTLGEFSDALVLGTFGEIPEDAADLASAAV